MSHPQSPPLFFPSTSSSASPIFSPGTGFGTTGGTKSKEDQISEIVRGLCRQGGYLDTLIGEANVLADSLNNAFDPLVDSSATAVRISQFQEAMTTLSNILTSTGLGSIHVPTDLDSEIASGPPLTLETLIERQKIEVGELWKERQRVKEGAGVVGDQLGGSNQLKHDRIEKRTTQS